MRGARRGEEGLAPTPERRRQGPVERLSQAIADEAGRPARPFRAADTLGLMLKRRTITPEMHQAGEDFRALFRRAALDPLQAYDPARPRAGRGCVHAPDPAETSEAARRRVWRALERLGGAGAPAGSCAWHVLGLEWTIKEWARRARWAGRETSPEAASGILIAALGSLAGDGRG